MCEETAGEWLSLQSVQKGGDPNARYNKAASIYRDHYRDRRRGESHCDDHCGPT